MAFVLPGSCHARVRAESFQVRQAGWEVGPDELAALDIDWARGGGVPLMRAVLRELILPKLDEAHDALESACDGDDLLVCHVNQVMGPIVSARTGIPMAALSLFPMVVPTIEGLASSPVPQLPGGLRKALMPASFAPRPADWPPSRAADRLLYLGWRSVRRDEIGEQDRDQPR